MSVDESIPVAVATGTIRTTERIAAVERNAEVESTVLRRQVSSMAAELERLRGDLISERERTKRVGIERDPLTGLRNRNALLHRLRATVEEGSLANPTGALVMIDIARFAQINSGLGPLAGDEVLVAVAGRLRDLAGPEVFRVSGDQFALLLADVHDHDQALAAARRGRDTVTAPLNIANQRLTLNAALGVALVTETDTALTLLQRAEQAMHRAKQGEDATIQLIAVDGTGVDRQDRFALVNDLRLAIERGQISLAYQPRRSVVDGRVLGAEALLRWNHPTRGSIPPSVFVPVAEEEHLIAELGRWALEEACAAAARWVSCGMRDLRVSVNLSAKQLNLRLLGDIERVLEMTGIHASLLELELTESALMEADAGPVILLETLAERGVRLSLDDFGTGYSSLAYLQRLPVSTLKIDRIFVSEISSEPGSGAVARAIVGLARTLGLDVVAEGVERAEQLEVLRAAGCEEYQGFLGSPPLSEYDFVRLAEESELSS